MLNRRELIAALIGSQAALIAGCGGQRLPPQGELLAPSFELGHRLRDGYRPQPNSGALEDVGVVIIGGGIAGLSAAWRLLGKGQRDFVVLELESVAGGTARSQRSGPFAYPWGAHYLPTPMRESEDLVQLLDEMGTLEQVLADGTPLVAEQFLCREPAERIFVDGQWYEGLFPAANADSRCLRQLAEFRDEVDRWVERRDQQGRRMFAIPTHLGSDDPQVMALDQISMADWIGRHGWDSPRLRWLIDYCCRDDYGLGIEQTSGWAGVFYFASRVRNPGDESQGVITWPEGNGRIVNHLSKRCGDALRMGYAVSEVKPGDSQSRAEVVAIDRQNDRVIGFRAERVIFAAPQFLAKHLINGDTRDSKAFQYGSWIVANVHLSGRPAERGFPMAWDNVIYGSKSLGYVTSTHQSGRDHGPTVLTWYHPLVNVDPRLPRKQLLTLEWTEWCDLVMSDLAVPHPDIGELVERVDLMRWGHAMIQPRVGVISSAARRQAAQRFERIHFAGTDLSGIALMEEAFYHGLRAADEVLSTNV